jgi:hypothetical protein
MRKKTIVLITAFLLVFFSNTNLCAEVKSEKFWPYLGIYTSALEIEVSHQLDLPRNLYLNIEKVEKGSPAANSGVQQFDILLRLDDQILVNPDQLKYLVRSKKPNDVVSLSLIRKGKSKTIELKLGKTEQLDESSERNSVLGQNFGNRSFLLDPLSDVDPDILNLLDRHSFMPFPYIDKGLMHGRNGNQFNDHSTDDDPLHAPTDTNTFSYKSSKSQKFVTDDQGTLELKEKDGKKTLRVTDSSGNVLFNGPINTAEEKKSLSPAIAERLKKLEKKSSVK